MSVRLYAMSSGREWLASTSDAFSATTKPLLSMSCELRAAVSSSSMP